MPDIEVMLVEDHPEYRETLALALSKAKDINITHEFGTAEQAINFAEQDSSNTTPDLILLDLNLPGLSGIKSIPIFKQHYPKTPIIILTQSDREADVLAAISAGASGYLLKSSSRDQLIDGIRHVIEGGAPLDSKIAKFILTTLQNKSRKTNKECLLSEREIEVLTLLGEGLVKKEIADRLDISVHTVDNHMRHMYEKLHVQNAPSAISKAYRDGILPKNQ